MDAAQAPADPALLIDIDGVLNPFAAAGRPAGYTEHRYRPGLPWGPDGLRVWLCPDHGRQLTEFARQHRFELVWATTWEHEANRWVVPRIGLDAWLPVITFGPEHPVKRPAVDRWARRRPIAWLDDSFEPLDFEWADRRAAEVAPTLLVPVQPEVGLRAGDLRGVAGWAAGWAAERAAGREAAQ